MEHLIKALACLKAAQEHCDQYEGKHDFLDLVKEKLDDAKEYIKDTIEMEA
jgi:hypothetical protein